MSGHNPPSSRPPPASVVGEMPTAALRLHAPPSSLLPEDQEQAPAANLLPLLELLGSGAAPAPRQPAPSPKSPRSPSACGPPGSPGDHPPRAGHGHLLGTSLSFDGAGSSPPSAASSLDFGAAAVAEAPGAAPSLGALMMAMRDAAVHHAHGSAAAGGGQGAVVEALRGACKPIVRVSDALRGRLRGGMGGCVVQTNDHSHSHFSPRALAAQSASASQTGTRARPCPGLADRRPSLRGL